MTRHAFTLTPRPRLAPLAIAAHDTPFRAIFHAFHLFYFYNIAAAPRRVHDAGRRPRI